MENTCQYPNCPYAKLTEEMCKELGIKADMPESCQNFFVSHWQDDKDNTTTVRDCALRRVPIMIQGIYKVLGVNATEISKLRGEQEKIKTVFAGALVGFDNAIKQIRSQTGEQKTALPHKDSDI